MSDGVMSVESLKGELLNVQFAKWKLIADKPLPEDSEFWLREENRKWKFLVEDDAELIALKKALDDSGVRYGVEENVELTARDKRWIMGSGITSRNGAQRVLDNATKIDGATDLDGIKDAMADTGVRV